MKRILCGILILSVVCSLFGCGGKNKNDSTPVGSLSANKLFTQTDDLFQFLMEEDTTREDVIARCGTDEYGDCDYETIEMFGYEGELDIKFSSDGKISNFVFGYKFPGFANWVVPEMDAVYYPSDEDKRACQKVMNAIKEELTEVYGQPNYAENGIYGWDLSDDFFQRYLSVAAQESGDDGVLVGYSVD